MYRKRSEEMAHRFQASIYTERSVTTLQDVRGKGYAEGQIAPADAVPARK